MECVYGKQRATIDRAGLAARAAAYPYTWVDLGTGDGRYVQHLAVSMPRWLIVGVDACREQLRTSARAGRPNALFAIANALDLPTDLDGLAHRVSINFPWGSLFAGLVEGDAGLLSGLGRISMPECLLELRLNGGAFAELGISAAAGTARVAEVLASAGWQCAAPTRIEAKQLRALETSWSRRLAHGREPWAIGLRAVRLRC